MFTPFNRAKITSWGSYVGEINLAFSERVGVTLAVINILRSKVPGCHPNPIAGQKAETHFSFHYPDGQAFQVNGRKEVVCYMDLEL